MLEGVETTFKWGWDYSRVIPFVHILNSSLLKAGCIVHPACLYSSILVLCFILVFVSLKELQLLTVLNVLATLYQDVNLTDVQDEKIPKSRRKVLSTAIKDNINKIWTLLNSTLVVSLYYDSETMLCFL